MSFGIFLSVVISAVAVWMDLKDASVDNGWILFSFIMGDKKSVCLSLCVYADSKCSVWLL